MEENIGINIAKEATKEIAKDAYSDVVKPVVQPTGELVGLLPRAIKAALAPVEKWVLQREYNVAETKKLLEEKLSSVPPELIEAPEPHIAVPALQYISYCMDNEELRDMYANLLANSMNKIVKNGVHPGFIEIIKQLCPDEAKILREIMMTEAIPVITLRRENEKGTGETVIRNFSNIGELAECEEPYEMNRYFNNLIRLGLLEKPGSFSSLADKSMYKSLENHTYILPYIKEIEQRTDEYNKVSFTESYIYMTDYGKKFCSICLGTIKTATILQN